TRPVGPRTPRAGAGSDQVASGATRLGPLGEERLADHAEHDGHHERPDQHIGSEQDGGEFHQFPPFALRTGSSSGSASSKSPVRWRISAKSNSLREFTLIAKQRMVLTAYATSDPLRVA